MNTTTLPAGYELPAELLASQRTLDDLVAKAKKTRAAVDATAAELPNLDAEVQELTAKLAVKDADRWTAEDSEVKALDAEIKKLADALDAKQRALNRAKNALIIHEARAPEHDEEVQAAVIVLENDLIAFGGDLMESLRAELLEKVKPLQGIFEAFRAIGALGGHGVRDIIDAAYVPDPKGFIRMGTGAGFLNHGTNLIAEAPEAEHAQLARAIAAALAPVRASLGAAKGLGAYVPLDKRPKPYARRGYTHEGVKGDSRKFGGDEPATPMGPKPLPPSTGFKRSMNSDGTPIEDGPDRKMSSLVHRLA